MGRPKRSDTSGIVYLISFPNGKKYVGITTNSLDERKSSHISHRNTSALPVHQALKKYLGTESWEIIGKATSWEALTRLEILKIEEYKSLTNLEGYNLTIGGDGSSGYKHNDLQKRRNSDAKKIYFSKEENRNSQSIANQRAHSTKPHLATNHSELQRKRFESIELRNKVSIQVREYLSDPGNLIKHSKERGAKYFTVCKLDGTHIGKWLAQHECARDLELDVGKINMCLHGKRKTHAGYTFSFDS